MNGQPLPVVEAALKGENPYVFRVLQSQVGGEELHPSVRVEEGSGRSATELVSITPNFSEHREVAGIPFVASYLSMDKVFNDLPQIDKSHVEKIESYVRNRVIQGNYNDSAEAAAKIIESLEKKLNLTRNHDAFYRAERMSAYITNLTSYNEYKTTKARITGTLQKEERASTRSEAKPDKEIVRKNQALKSVVSQLLKAL